MDVKGVFLHAPIEEEIHSKEPKGYLTTPNKVLFCFEIEEVTLWFKIKWQKLEHKAWETFNSEWINQIKSRPISIN